MIVDLLRNDLGRVAIFGSVRVPSLFDVERYPTVWQLTSTVTARLPPGVGVPELFGALFPSGSVTGAPKRAAMQAIVTLEGRPRGVYCGAVGFIRPDPVRPSARFAVAIRTVTVANRSGVAEYGAGGGITASSRPEAEWSELLAKSLVLRDAERPRSLIETFRFEPCPSAPAPRAWLSSARCAGGDQRYWSVCHPAWDHSPPISSARRRPASARSGWVVLSRRGRRRAGEGCRRMLRLRTHRCRGRWSTARGGSTRAQRPGPRGAPSWTGRGGG
jgi:hypothetical protein